MTTVERPFHRSYWAIPGKLLAGCYPGDLDPAQMDQKLSALVSSGVTLVVNLMEADESDHTGKPFLDFANRLHQLAEISGRSVRVQRYPIPDRSIPSRRLMDTILEAIDQEIDSGGTVYVHCWGGKGRTATVVGCMMLNEELETPQTILKRLHQLTAHASNFFWPTPQTAEQCDFVINWRDDNE